MELKGLTVDLVRIPSDIQVLLCLIREDLKATKLFTSLRQIGCVDTPYQSDLTELLLAAAGFEEQTEELHIFYFQLMERYSTVPTESPDDLMRQTFMIYAEIMGERRRRQKM